MGGAFSLDSQLVAYCVVHAGRDSKVPPEALLAMMMQENGRPGMKRANPNGSYDLGVMQINTVWLADGSPLKYYVTERQLADDVCANIHTAAWILARHNSSTHNIWRAIGKYHAPHTLTYANRYVLDVYAHLPAARRLIAGSAYFGYYSALLFGPGEGAVAAPVAAAGAR